MLPAHERVLLKVNHIVVGWLRAHFEQQPADVREEKSLADVVRILFMIDIFVVPAVFAAPHEGRVLKRRRAEKKR